MVMAVTGISIRSSPFGQATTSRSVAGGVSDRSRSCWYLQGRGSLFQIRAPDGAEIQRCVAASYATTYARPVLATEVATVVEIQVGDERRSAILDAPTMRGAAVPQHAVPTNTCMVHHR